jgi:hypothetical protein
VGARVIYTPEHLTDRAAFLRDFPGKTLRQQQNARAQENVRRRRRGEPELSAVDTPVVRFPDKKVGSTDWREISEWVGRGQDLRHKGGWSQNHATVEVQTPHESILLIPFGDAHIGSWGASLDSLVAFTNEVRSNPRLYLGGVGDLINLAIKLRSVIEVKDDILPPDMQHNFFAAWMEEMTSNGKLLFAGFGNHDVEREEAGAGSSIHKRMLERRVPYFAGIGHVDIAVGAQQYKVAVSHRFSGSTGGNPLGGQKKYMRFEGQDRTIAIAGDLHRPTYESYYDGPTHRIALNCGSLQTGSGYAQRYFSLFTIPEYPCIELFATEHRAIPYKSVGDWKRTVERQ